MHVLVIAALSVAVVSVVFVLQNPGLVAIHFLYWNFTGSLALVLLVTFALGFITSILMSLSAGVKRRLTIRSQQRKIEDLQAMLEERSSGGTSPTLHF